MKLTKAAFNKDTAWFMNAVREIAGVNIANVGWHSKPWKVVATDNFDEVADRGYTPIVDFRTKDELFSWLKKNV